MKEIYTTPNGEWKIVEQSDPEWQAVFGKQSVYFNAVRTRDNFLVFSGGKVSPVLEWFCKMKIISSDEMKHQINLLESSNGADTE